MKIRCWLRAAAAVGGSLASLTQAPDQGWMQTTTPTNPWRSVASQANGNKLVAAASGYSNGRMYFSTDSGATWTDFGSATAT